MGTFVKYVRFHPTLEGASVSSLLLMSSTEGMCHPKPSFHHMSLIITRRYRIKWALIGLTSFILAITAIELTLRYNQVVKIQSITSTGQYVSLIVGIGSFTSVCWSLVQQEAVSTVTATLDLHLLTRSRSDDVFSIVDRLSKKPE